MEFQNILRPTLISLAAVASVGFATTASAGPNRAVEACKTAIAEEQGPELVTRLKKVQPRGGSYEAWFNLTDGDTQLKAYCLNKRSSTEIITSEGVWKGRNLKRPSMSDAQVQANAT